MSFFVPLITALAPLASAGLSIASQAGAFGGGGGKSKPDPALAAMKAQQAEEKKTAASEERKRKAYLASLAGGRGSTLLTSGKGVQGGDVLEQGLKATLGA